MQVPKSKSTSTATTRTSRLRAALLAASLLQIPAMAQADYVGSLTNRVFLDPASISELIDGYDNGDEIAYILETTPRDTGSDFGIAAWATVYVPPGVQIIGADYVRPALSGWVTDVETETDDSYDGWGSRGSKNYTPNSGTTQLEDGRVTDVNQDVGIFYSTDPRTVGLGSLILPQITPTGPETKPAEIYNQWDYDQVLAFGTSGALSGNKGTGNSPLVSTDSGATWKGTGSAVAGPDTRYTNDYNPACDGAAACTGTTCAFAADLQCAGPWQRIKTAGSLIANSGAVLPATATGAITNTSVPTSTGVVVNGANPLPAGTNAVRYVHGARRLGELEYSRVKFRITDATAFLNALNANNFCLESTGGDTSKTAAKDQPWRYYEPEHRCFQELNGPAENAILLKRATHVNGCPSVGDFLEDGDVVSYEITMTNISGSDLTQVSFSDAADSFLTLLEPGNAKCAYASYDGDIPGPTYNASSATGGTATWQTIDPLASGQSVTVHLCGVVTAAAKAGDVVANTATANYKLVNESTEELTSTASGTVAGGLVNGIVEYDSDSDGNFADLDPGIDGVVTTLWHDVNGNGKVDAGDVNLGTNDTISDGSYHFSGLAADKYVIQETDPADSTSTADADTAAGNCATGNGCNEIAVTLTAGSSSRCNDFLDAPACGNGVLGGSEQCDEGQANGTTASCCTVDCTFKPVDTVCRGLVGICDAAEVCTGSSPDCPADSYKSSATACRDSAGVCDTPEDCSGASPDCPADGFQSSQAVCRDSAGVCDVVENCSGNSVACPADVFGSSTTVCRASAGVCDTPEDCSGDSAACPADTFVSSATACRAASGVCDTAENCTGSAASCPANAFLGSQTTCRASAGVCDNAEVCSGSSASCPTDSLKSSATTCRAANGVCDVAETCTGSAPGCPADGFKHQGASCTSDSNVCTDDTCTGSGTCNHANNTASCDDGAFCTVNDVCSAGQCSGSARQCGDEVSCTGDFCNENTDSCDHTPYDEVCGDRNSCTIDTCDVQEGCKHVFACKDICRTSGFYSKRSGDEKADDNLVQDILNAAEGITVCGQFIDKTTNESDPWVEGLGLSSAVEGLCVRREGVEERSLYKELVAARLNCVMSGSDDCDGVVEEFINASYSNCDAICSGDARFESEEDYNSAVNACTHELACYNAGGRMIAGQCAFGKCDVTDELCGSDYGPCPAIPMVTFPILQTCERFPGNCREEAFCQPGLEICPAKTPVSSARACKEAKTNECTIDSCPVSKD